MSDSDRFELVPSVDESREFLEIASDFANPLDLVREAISNSYDHDASNITLLFDVVDQYGEPTLTIQIEDDGIGMNRRRLEAFFNLGDSPSRDRNGRIGEKGHGTKIYFHSSRVEVATCDGNNSYKARMENPFRSLHDGEIPQVKVERKHTPGNESGTSILITGYNHNRRKHFNHLQIRDHIQWFTKHGSIEHVFGRRDYSDVTVYLSGLDYQDSSPEELSFGHPFPETSASISELFDQHFAKAARYYCDRFTETGHLPNFPDIEYWAVFSIEGSRVKYSYNDLLRRRGMTPPEGAYRTDQRYGLWVCKDFIPVERKNEWIADRGWEFTQFHAFINCQRFNLTANRGSVDNTLPEIMDDVQTVASRIYDNISSRDEWRELQTLKEEVKAYKTEKQEEEDYEYRKRRANRAKTAKYMGATLVEPDQENGVFAIVIQLLTVDEDSLPFTVVDYDTQRGIDLLVKGDASTPINYAKLYYVELKRYLTDDPFNHTFRNLHSIVCWDTDLAHNQVVEDLTGEERKVRIHGDENDGYTKFFLDREGAAHKIEVIVLRQYLKEQFDIEFTPRTGKETH